MPGPPPMHPTARQRQNKVSTAAELFDLAPADRALIDVPELPSDRLWDPKTSDWWRDVWQSPMRLEWDAADHHSILVMAYLFDEFMRCATADEPNRKDLVALAKSVRDQARPLGLDPFARRSLNWLLVQTERDEASRDLTQAKAVTERKKTTRKGLSGLE